jgi:putative restriction endonuclease
MRYWWVNQNQTARHEIAGGYLWSPKRRRNGTVNPFYEFMREVAPGDLVFSFADTRIGAFGVARSHAFEAPKPAEFGTAGRNWDQIGWRVEVTYQLLPRPFRPADHMHALRPLLPDRYAPLQADGRGSQSIYLTELPRALALVLAQLAGTQALAIAQAESGADPDSTAVSAELTVWEEHLRRRVESDATLRPTEKEAIVLARRGQGLFRENVQQFETRCRITGVSRPEHLRASHCKPWRDASNSERLDGSNGLLLTPSIDHLFDRGFISFRDDGRLLVSPVAHGESLSRMGVPVGREVETGSFAPGQRSYLQYHRDEVFLASRVRA